MRVKYTTLHTKLLSERGQGLCGASKDLGQALGLSFLHESTGLGIASGSGEDRDGAERKGGKGSDGLEQHGDKCCGGAGGLSERKGGTLRVASAATCQDED